MKKRCCFRLNYLESLFVLSLLALTGQLLIPGTVDWWNRPSPGRQGEIRLRRHNELIGLSPECLVYLPNEYAKDWRRWPVIVFLHGAGLRGADVSMVRRDALPLLIDQGLRLPAIVVSPQCAAGCRWDNAAVLEVVEQLIEDYRADEHRIYLTGYSMGAAGAWKVAAAAPKRFAAMVTIAGGANPRIANKLTALPIWAFHGVQDDVVPISSTARLINAIRESGGAPRFTALAEKGHNIAIEVLSDEGTISWMLDQNTSTIRY